MRKILLFLAVAFLAISCEGPAGPMGPPGEPGAETGWKIISFKVNSNQWQLDDDGLEPYYFYTFSNISDLTNFVFKDGAVIGYIDFGGVRTPLPFVEHHSNEHGQLWTETIDFRYAPKEITFFTTFSDFSPDGKPQTRDFKVVLIW